MERDAPAPTCTSEPRGGEIALWFRVFGDTERNEPFTYNEWWMALVLARRFKRDWGKCERETTKKPDAAAKRALLARLKNRLNEEPDYLDDLEFERPSTPADHQRAEKWYDRESVSDARAW